MVKHGWKTLVLQFGDKNPPPPNRPTDRPEPPTQPTEHPNPASGGAAPRGRAARCARGGRARRSRCDRARGFVLRARPAVTLPPCCGCNLCHELGGDQPELVAGAKKKVYAGSELLPGGVEEGVLYSVTEWYASVQNGRHYAAVQKIEDADKCGLVAHQHLIFPPQTPPEPPRLNDDEFSPPP